MLDDSVAFRKFPKITGLSIATPLAAVSASSAVGEWYALKGHLTHLLIRMETAANPN